MSRKDPTIERAVDAYREYLIEEQNEIWETIRQERFVSILDKQPTFANGLDFLNSKIHAPPPLIDPFFPSGGLCMLHGKPGLGKTMLAMSMVRSLCTGEDFLGRFPVSKSTVVYIQLDMVDFVFQDRLLKAGDYYKFDDWYVLTGVASILHAKESDSWVQDVVATQPDLIIIDTLRQAHSLSENDSDSAGRFFAKVRELFGYTAVMVIHHDKKDSPDAVFTGQEMQRGSIAWTGPLDLGLRLHKKGKQLYVGSSKTRVSRELEDIPVLIDEATMSIQPCDFGDFKNRTPARGGSGGTTAADAIRDELVRIDQGLQFASDGVWDEDVFKGTARAALLKKGFPADRVSKGIKTYLLSQH